MDHELEDHDRGLSFDLVTLMERRRALKLFAGAGLFALVGCANGTESTSAGSGATSTSNPTDSTESTDTTATTDGADASCSTVPEETAGPYPGDGSNGPNVLTESGIVRRDITLELRLVERDRRGRAAHDRAGDRRRGQRRRAPGRCRGLRLALRPEGGYSMYSQGVTDQNYLRGVQETGTTGR